MFELNRSLLTFITEYELIYKLLQVFIVCLWCPVHTPARRNFQKRQWRWDTAEEASVDFWALSSHCGVEGRCGRCVSANRSLIWAGGMERDRILSKCETRILPGGRLHGTGAHTFYEVKSAAGDIFLGHIHLRDIYNVPVWEQSLVYWLTYWSGRYPVCFQKALIFLLSPEEVWFGPWCSQGNPRKSRRRRSNIAVLLQSLVCKMYCSHQF